MSLAFVGRVVVYTITGCPHCLAAKALLRDKSVPFLEVNVNHHPEVVDWLRDRTKKTSVPQIFFNKQHVGGNQELQAVASDDTKWKDLVDMVLTQSAPDDTDPLVPDMSSESQGQVGGVVLTCEADQNLVLISDLRNSDVVKPACSNSFLRFITGRHSDSVQGADLVNFIAETRKLSREDAVKASQVLVTKGLLKSSSTSAEFDEQATYKLPARSNSSALNADVEVKCVAKPLSELGEALRQMILQIHAEFLSADGKRVDYAGIRASQAYEKYKEVARQLQNVDLKDSNENQRLAFFINVYNALVIHGFVERGSQPANHLDRYLFFSKTSYNIGGFNYSLNDIENGVLRSNQSSFGTLYSIPFKAGDPRLDLAALSSPEPRIHFALNCGAASCPPIKTFSGANIEKELNLATQAFLENDEGLKLADATVYLSMLFSWYKVDFGKDDEQVLKWVSDHVGDNQKKTDLEKIIASKTFTLKYNQYDWGSNSK